MPITASYDPEADALYVRLSDDQRDRTIEIDDVIYIDVAAAGQIVGLELLYPSLGIDAQKIADATKLHSRMTEILAAIAAVGAPLEIPTVTGGGAFTTVSSQQSMATEGTIAGGTFVGSLGESRAGASDTRYSVSH
jgi:uncharacterized protein YuzE